MNCSLDPEVQRTPGFEVHCNEQSYQILTHFLARETLELLHKAENPGTDLCDEVIGIHIFGHIRWTSRAKLPSPSPAKPLVYSLLGKVKYFILNSLSRIKIPKMLFQYVCTNHIFFSHLFSYFYIMYSEAAFDNYNIESGLKSARAKFGPFLLHCKSIKIKKGLCINNENWKLHFKTRNWVTI